MNKICLHAFHITLKHVPFDENVAIVQLYMYFAVSFTKWKFAALNFIREKKRYIAVK